MDYSDFNNEFKEILNHHAPIKQTKVRGNTKPHINKALRKEIMAYIFDETLVLSLTCDK